MNMTTLGIDLAKNVFQLHGANCGKKVFGKRVSRKNFQMHTLLISSTRSCISFPCG